MQNREVAVGIYSSGLTWRRRLSSSTGQTVVIRFQAPNGYLVQRTRHASHPQSIRAMLLDCKRHAIATMYTVARIIVARKPASAAEAPMPHTCEFDSVSKVDCGATRSALLVHFVRRPPVTTWRRKWLLCAGPPSTIQYTTAANVIPRNDITTA